MSGLGLSFLTRLLNGSCLGKSHNNPSTREPEHINPNTTGLPSLRYTNSHYCCCNCYGAATLKARPLKGVKVNKNNGKSSGYREENFLGMLIKNCLVEVASFSNAPVMVIYTGRLYLFISTGRVK